MLNKIKLTTLNSSKPYKEGLENLLIDCVNGGASIGFVLPISRHEAQIYWEEVNSMLETGEQHLIVASLDDEVIGSVQIGLTKKHNGKHRGEVQKLMVSSKFRSKGLGSMLMEELEGLSNKLGLKLLVLDTREGDISEKLYSKIGFERVGIIPKFALDSDENYVGTAIYYKLLA